MFQWRSCRRLCKNVDGRLHSTVSSSTLEDCPRDQWTVLAIFRKNSSNNLKQQYLLVYAKTCSKSLHISHGRGVVAALRRNQFDPQIARSARNSLTFPASYLWVKLEVQKLVLKIQSFFIFSAPDLSGSLHNMQNTIFLPELYCRLSSSAYYECFIIYSYSKCIFAPQT